MSGNKRGTVIAKQKWTDEEEAALRAGVEKYEAGKWRHIQKDSEFGPILKNRSNVDLKDKWRNLNMDSGGSRRDSRGGGDKSGKRRRRKRTEKTSDTGAEDDDADYIAGRVHASGKRRRVPRRRYDEEEPESSYPEQTPPQVTDVTEENILAAMIQLQNPEGAAADTICEMLEDNYGVSASGKRSVKYLLKQMIEAGRLTQEGGFYKLAGFPKQMVEDSKQYTGGQEGLPYSWNTVSSKTAKEAAEAAARAVQEAEEAAELATELIAAADKFDRETDETVDQDKEEAR